ncbi:MAG: hypothetical protein ACLPX7_22150 [Xanthobacteraceae bacterium]
MTMQRPRYVQILNVLSLGQRLGAISVCALRRYVTGRETLVASYNWHVAQASTTG